MIFTLDKEGVNLNMNFICPHCSLELWRHDVDIFTGEPPQIKFVCPEIDGERQVWPLEVS
jgi:hypothetical protein